MNAVRDQSRPGRDGCPPSYVPIRGIGCGTTSESRQGGRESGRIVPECRAGAASSGRSRAALRQSADDRGCVRGTGGQSRGPHPARSLDQLAGRFWGKMPNKCINPLKNLLTTAVRSVMFSAIFLAYPCGSWSLAKQARQGPLFSPFIILVIGGGPTRSGRAAVHLSPGK
jgi:hypothetical protein